MGGPMTPDPEKKLSEALSEYETYFYEKVRNALDQSAEEAKAVVTQARAFLMESRLAYAICRPVLEYVKYWPSWSEKYSGGTNGPFRYIDSRRDDSNPKSKIAVVDFSYNSAPFTLRFIDEGMPIWDTEDMNSYGKVELIVNGKTVLGLDISKDESKGDLAHWRMSNVYALLPGSWMRKLIEMAAYIDGNTTREHSQRANKDALERAAGIQLPPKIFGAKV